MNSFKVLAVNSDDKELMEFLAQKEQSTYEVDNGLFEKRYACYSNKGMAQTFVMGNLVDTPKPLVNPLDKKGESIKKIQDTNCIEDNDYVYSASLCYETDVFYNNKAGSRHANTNFIQLLFASRGAKASISHYKKGDAIIVHAHLRSIREKNPVDPTKSYNVQMLVVDSFIATPGTHLRNEINQKFANADKKGKYKSIADVLRDKSISKEEQDKFIAELARAEYAPKDSNSVTDNSQPQQAAANYASNEAPYQDAPLPPSDEEPKNEDYELNNDSGSLSHAFDRLYENE